MKSSSAATNPVSSAVALAALAGALAITTAYGWTPVVAKVAPAPQGDAEHVLTAATMPVLTMRNDCDGLAPRLEPAAPPAHGARRTAAPATRTDSASGGEASGAHANPRCGPDGIGSPHAERRVEGLGSGWIISADGVMRMNPYGLSDRHTITIRPADDAREFKGRIIGLDPTPGAETSAKAQDATPAPNGPRVASPAPLDRPLSVPAVLSAPRKTT